MSKMSFRLLFDNHIISQWKQHYLNYSDCKTIIKKIASLNKSIKHKEKNLAEVKLESTRELLKMQIEEESNLNILN